MPLTHDAVENRAYAIDTTEVTSFSVDLQRNEVHIGYDQGHMDAGVFVPDLSDLVLTVDQSQFAAFWNRANVRANAMSANSVNVVRALKLTTLDRIKLDKEIVGTVD